MPLKDKEERKKYRKKYYEQNKETILTKNKEYRKKYRELYREEINAKKRQYESSPERRAKKREKSKKDYILNKDHVKARCSVRRKAGKAFIDEVCMRYGCQNPDCKWAGNFTSSQLTFHHFDRTKKETEVSRMHSWSHERIVIEINKCVVLCRNCRPLVDDGLIKIDESMMCKIEVPL